MTMSAPVPLTLSVFASLNAYVPVLMVWRITGQMLLRVQSCSACLMLARIQMVHLFRSERNRERNREINRERETEREKGGEREREREKKERLLAAQK